MILSDEDLRKNKGAAWAMVDGCFDPLHIGHLRYFEAAAKLNVPIFCNVQGDNYIRKTKRRPSVLPEDQRAFLIDSLKAVSYVHLCKDTTADVLEKLAPRFYIKGIDWKERGLPEREQKVCREQGIEVVYLDTVFDSSTSLSRKYFENYSREVSAVDVNQFESVVLGQKIVQDQHYNEHYFNGGWREGGNDYTLENRRRIEGKNPQNIKDVFDPKCVLDLGCGPGALMFLMKEVGVNCYGIDFSEGAKQSAPKEVADRIHVGSVTDYYDFGGQKFDLVVCRELLEHLTVLQVRQAIANMCKLTTKYVYATTRFHPSPTGLLDITDDKQTDPTHITVLNKDFMRTLFVLEGMRCRPDMEQKLDWKNYGRVLVYEKVTS